MRKQSNGVVWDMSDLAFLILRAVVGGLFVGHGAQKLFGWFGGGVAGTAGFLAALGLRPAPAWAFLAGMSELGGGLLTLLGFLDPLGSVALIAAQMMAIATVHWGKPIWATEGGAELPLAYATVAIALLLAGPGAYALDQALGLDLGWMAVPALVGAALGIAAVLLSRDRPRPVGVSQGQPAEEATRPA
jgi:putative oxidoreductase